MYESITNDFFSFLKQAPTCFHVVEVLRQHLLQAGYAELTEDTQWELTEHGRYFVTRNGSSLIAFQLPKKNFTGFQLAASHSDSPGFKLKAKSEMTAAGHYTRLNVERYGGMLYAPWFDRPLSIAGRVIVRTGDEFSCRLVDIDRTLLIPNLAIHMDRSANDTKKYNPQVDLLPVLGDETAEDCLFPLLAAKLGVDPQQIVSSDLFLYNRMEPVFWGMNHEFIAGPRLDDLQCTYASFRGFLDAENVENVPVFAVFDNEEVGSGTKQGASGTFLKDTLRRIHLSCAHDEEAFLRSLAVSFMVSADNAHAVHPNHAERADEGTRPHLNGGVVFKYNANQKYTTDAVSAAIMKTICEKAGGPYQEFHNRSDIVGGSALGNLSHPQVSLNTVDIGLAQLAMHSAYECAGAKDTAYMAAAMRQFYSSHIRLSSAGCLTLESPAF